MIMTVLMHDAMAKLSAADRDLAARGDLVSLLYADDTLLLGIENGSVQRFMVAVADVGATYGLQLHWGKLQQLNLRCSARLHQPDGTVVTPCEQLTYLGSIISEDGRVRGELVRRLGFARGSFRELARVWRHSSVGRQKKIMLFNALVVPILMYALQVAWLNKAETRQLDGFQCRCLRAIWGTKTAFVNRISNSTIFLTTRQKPLSLHLERQQLLYFGKVARSDAASPLKRAAFSSVALMPATHCFIRRVGRP